MTDYKDYTELPELIDTSVAEPFRTLAANVRNKQKGKDVRESLAQAIESSGHIRSDWEGVVGSQTEDLEARAARVNSLGKVFPTLKSHLDAMELYSRQALAQQAEDAASIKDLEDLAGSVRYSKDTIKLGDLDQEVALAISGGSVAVLDGQSVRFPNLFEQMQKDLGAEVAVDYVSSAGGWTDKGVPDNSAYAMQSYNRTAVNISPGELVTFELKLPSIKRFCFMDSKGSFISFFDSSEELIQLKAPLKTAEVRVQFYKAGSVKPSIVRLAYDSAVTKTLLEKRLKEEKEDFLMEPNLAGQSIKFPLMEEQYQIDTGVPSALPLTWEPGGWEENGKPNNATYALANYVRAEYRPEYRQKGRAFLLTGKFTPKLHAALLLSDGDKVLNTFFSTDAKTIRFSASADTASIKVQSYPNTPAPTLSHYVYDSIASKEFVKQSINEKANGLPILQGSDSLKVLYHRTFNDNSPEQTEYGFYKTKLIGGLWAECDALLTKDNQLVVIHDDTINRTARNLDGSVITTPIAVKESTLAELRAFDYGIKWGPEFAGEKILTLAEALKLCHKLNLKLRIEVKQTPTPAYLKALKETLEPVLAKDSYELISASTYDMNLIKNEFKDVNLVLVCANFTDNFRDFVLALKNSGRDISVALQVENIDKNDNMPRLQATGLKYEFWTVDTRETLNKCLQYYPVAITTNKLKYYETVFWGREL